VAGVITIKTLMMKSLISKNTSQPVMKGLAYGSIFGL